jgi:transposase
MPNVTGFAAPDLTTFCRLDGLGLVAVGQKLSTDRAEVLCVVADPDDFCQQCGQQGRPRDSVVRRLAHEPLGWRPTTLVVKVRRYRCVGCGRVWRQDMSLAAEPMAKISRGGVRWGLVGIVLAHLSMARVAEGLGVAWNTANAAVLAEGERLLINNPARLDGVEVVGVDEHGWSHVRWNSKFVTVIIDLTPVRDGTGPSRLLDLVPGRSKAVFKTWLDERPQQWRDQIEIVAMDGFTGFKSAAIEEMPQVGVVMDPFHVVRLAGTALEEARRRIQQETLGRRGRRGDPLYSSRTTLMAGADLLTDRQRARINALFEPLEHAVVEATWGVYQDMIAAYRDPKPAEGKQKMEALISRITSALPKGLPEIRKLGRTLKSRAQDILAYFDNPRTSNGPTEAINGRLEHLRGIALGFRNIISYRLRALLECGGFRPQLHSQL